MQLANQLCDVPQRCLDLRDHSETARPDAERGPPRAFRAHQGRGDPPGVARIGRCHDLQAEADIRDAAGERSAASDQ